MTVPIWWASSAPAAPVRNAPTTKASSRDRWTLTPTARAAIRFSREAIIDRPNGELRIRQAT